MMCNILSIIQYLKQLFYFEEQLKLCVCVSDAKFVWGYYYNKNISYISDYLLSNNHINSIIIHKFDFSDEEVRN